MKNEKIIFINKKIKIKLPPVLNSPNPLETVFITICFRRTKDSKTAAYSSANPIKTFFKFKEDRKKNPGRVSHRARFFYQ